MEEKIQRLYQQIMQIARGYLHIQNRNNIESTRKLVPQIQEFVLWFLERNQFGMEEELYQGLSNNLLCILKDILVALEQEDMVLLHDAMAYGLREYLMMFNNTEEVDSDDDI